MSEVIGSFDGEDKFLSNFWEYDPFSMSEWDLKDIPTAEHAYQAAKTDVPDEAIAIMMASTPGRAKRLGLKCTLRPDWDEDRVPTMRFILKYKFASPTEGLGKRLVETGNALLIEGNNWNDTFWGICDGEGENKLGLLLMERRDELQAMIQETTSKEDTMNNHEGCHALNISGKNKGKQCAVPQKGMIIESDGRRFCNNHRPMFEEGKLTRMIPLPEGQGELVLVVDSVPTEAKVKHDEAMVKAGARQAREVIAEADKRLNTPTPEEVVEKEGGPIAQAYVNKEVLEVVTFTIAQAGSSSLHGQWGPKNHLKDNGYRPQLRAAKEKHGDALDAIVAAAPGADFVFGCSCIEEEVPYTVYLPSPSYTEYYWRPKGTNNNPRALEAIEDDDWDRIQRILDNAVEVKTICDHHQWGKANFRRNEAMINDCDVLWVLGPDHEKTPGTRHAFQYAQKQGVRTVIFS